MSKAVTDILKENLYVLATTDEEKAELDKVFSTPVQVPESGFLETQFDPSWFDINDYIERSYRYDIRN